MKESSSPAASIVMLSQAHAHAGGGALRQVYARLLAMASVEEPAHSTMNVQSPSTTI
jgi:hypothetical protein